MYLSRKIHDYDDASGLYVEKRLHYEANKIKIYQTLNTK